MLDGLRVTTSFFSTPVQESGVVPMGNNQFVVGTSSVIILALTQSESNPGHLSQPPLTTEPLG